MSVDVIWRVSPNHSVGREGTPIDRIVIHYIVGDRAAADATFSQPSSQVSAHYSIGEREVSQHVSEQNTAWHAGHLATNRRSVGIEHSADQNRAPDAWTMDTSVQLCIEICRRYGLDPQAAIIPHNSVSSTLCPNTVDWQEIRRRVAAGL
ncbi:MAG: peptidoglycan recognition family protein [Nesterenkonia sp.]|uniref:N-acetylmuramoyl-L-alanine amidase n=1 Tax=Nesterenkonia marinintestina TaxID=2979865 RepID=UPI0021BF1AB6|nr:peptidoglycan recognition family protein [Nesterenkonia sp. GX14115]MDO5493424.1 peptidoglycan recognition family protein [Nesterenkonia sp.]